jgi:hypothetical protein
MRTHPRAASYFVLVPLAFSAGCMGPEFPDDFEEATQPAVTADAGSTLPGNPPSGVVPQTDGGVLSGTGGPEAGVLAPGQPLEAGAMDAQTVADASGSPRPVRDAAIVQDADLMPDASASPDAETPPTPGAALMSCSITASTDASDTLFYAGKYGCAVWIGNASNKLVKTFFLATRIASRSGVATFQRQASGMTIDVVAGATLNSPKQHQYTWNLKDAKGASVPAGKYTLNVETHSSSGDTTVSVPFDTSSGMVNAMGSPSGGIRSATIKCQ